MKYYILPACLYLLALPVFGQSGEDKIIFKAMQDEMERNLHDLSLPKAPKPFFISYVVGTSHQFEVIGSLGSVLLSQNSPAGVAGGVKMLLGDYSMTSERKYPNSPTAFTLPTEVDYDLFRQSFWLETDAAYKSALQDYSAKVASRKRNMMSEEEKKLLDLEKTEPLTGTIEAPVTFEFDQKQWEDNIRELSSVFRNYPELFNSMVSVRGMDMEVYLKNSEGVTVKQPVQMVKIQAEADARTKDGVKITDSWSMVVAVPQQLPSVKELKEKIENFASKLNELKNSEPIAEFYCGPVLFEGGAVASIFTENLLSQSGLFAYRKPETPQPVRGGGGLKSLSDRINMKIIDNRVSIKNYSSLNKYNDTPLYGAYEVDAEGVKAPKETTLVENGILRGLLNGRVPALHATHSTGSSRYVANPDEVAYMTAPGTIHISVKNASKPENLKKQLLSIAKEDGLTYAYIVRKIAGASSLIYRVNVNDGKETLVRSGDISPVVLKNLRRMSGISAKENVTNFLVDGRVLSSMIYPSAMLLEDVEINKMESKKENEPALALPPVSGIIK